MDHAHVRAPVPPLSLSSSRDPAVIGGDHGLPTINGHTHHVTLHSIVWSLNEFVRTGFRVARLVPIFAVTSHLNTQSLPNALVHPETPHYSHGTVRVLGSRHQTSFVCACQAGKINCHAACWLWVQNEVSTYSLDSILGPAHSSGTSEMSSFLQHWPSVPRGALLTSASWWGKGHEQRVWVGKPSY